MRPFTGLAPLSSISVQDRVEPQRRTLSLGTIAAVSCAIMVYVMGRFDLTTLFDIKRELQVLLLYPIVLAAVASLQRYRLRSFNLLILYILMSLATELIMRGETLRILNLLASLAALLVLLSASRKSIELGVKTLVILATSFASLALLQWVILLLDPKLSTSAMIMITEDIVPDFTQLHPIAFLGFITDEGFSFLGFDIIRLQSFTSEPSLLNVYFTIPAAFALLLGEKCWMFCAFPILIFCILSFSGSVYLSFVYTLVFLISSRLFKTKRLFTYAPLIVLMFFISTVLSKGYDPFNRAISYLTSFGTFFEKTYSFNIRTASILNTYEIAIASPFGSKQLSLLPGPLFLDAALEAGWLGSLLLILFFRNIAKNVDVAYQQKTNFAMFRTLSISLWFGILSTIVVFNDYAVLSYGGYVLLMFLFRLTENPRVDTVRKKTPESTASAAIPAEIA